MQENYTQIQENLEKQFTENKKLKILENQQEESFGDVRNLTTEIFLIIPYCITFCTGVYFFLWRVDNSPRSKIVIQKTFTRLQTKRCS